MSFNKEKHLSANIEAIKLCFQLEKEKQSPTQDEINALKQYSGFGALKCILNPVETLSDIAHWPNSEVELFPLVAELHHTLKKNSKSDQQYKQYLGSLKNSILTAFYTPPELVQVLAETLNEKGVSPTKFLDPSAGLGEFISAFKNKDDSVQVTGIEKDLLTGKLLSHLHPNDKMRTMGFEEIESRYNNHFDVVSSNIPFGDVAVFDPEFRSSSLLAKKYSTQSIHNYFFIKAVDVLRDGGILAFITSQGLMNSMNNQPVRNWLMGECSLVSAIRLPNNLFTEYAGTEVGSDLIVLQKNPFKTSISSQEEDFIHSRKQKDGITVSDYFQDAARIVQTKAYLDTDPYGKPARISIHDGGILGIANDLKKMLLADLDKNLDLNLFQKNVNPVNKPLLTFEKNVTQKSTNSEQAPLTLYDLFDFSPEERTQHKPITKRNSIKYKGKQLNLFSQPRNINRNESNNEKLQLQETRTFAGILKAHYKEGSLVKDNGQIGFLKEHNGDQATFKMLRLNPIQQPKALLYINIRDTYHQLYNNEANDQKEDNVTRELLNAHYDSFVRKVWASE